MKNMIVILAVVSMVLMSSEGVFAQPPQGDDFRQPRRGFPQEAIDACEGKSEGDTVTVTGPDGKTMTATCTLIDGQLVAVPDNMPEPGGRGPGGPRGPRGARS